jgi:hypothetical protein
MRPLLKVDVELMIRWVDRLCALLEERTNPGPGANRQTARQRFDKLRANYQARLAQAK